MKGLRYSPLHVTEFCGEMQGKFRACLLGGRVPRLTELLGEG